MRVKFFILLLIAHLLFSQDTTGVGALSGTVQSSDKQSVMAAELCITSSNNCVKSDSQGRFRFTGLRPGTYTLDVKGPKVQLKSNPIQVAAGVESRVEITLPSIEASTQSLTVTESALVAPEEIKTSSYIVTGKDVFQNAGSLQDVSRFVQVLPGVAIGSDDFTVVLPRISSSRDAGQVAANLIAALSRPFEIDDQKMYAGGSVGILDANLIENVTFLTGGFPAPYINRASSVLQITQREGDRDKFGGRATLGYAGAGIIFEGPLGKSKKGSFVTSFRRTFLDLFTKDIGFGGVPVAYTFNTKLLYDLTSRDRIWLVNLTGVDNIRLGAREGQTEKDREEEVTNFDIRYKGRRSATGFNWQRVFSDRSVGLLGVTYSAARVNSSVRDLLSTGTGIPATGNIDDLIARSQLRYSENSREGETTIKYDFTRYMGESLKLQAGGNFKSFGVSYNSQSPFGDDSPYSVRPNLNPFTLDRQFRTSQSSGYAQITGDTMKRLSYTIGGRWDNYGFISRNRFSPRASLSYRLSQRMQLKASFGQYFQQPALLFLTVFPQNQNTLPFRADHYITGLSYRFKNGVLFTVEGYRKNYKDYPVASQFPSLSLANLGDTFAVRTILFPLESAGRGSAQGLELYAEKRFGEKWFAIGNLSFSKSRQAGLDGIERPSSFDYNRIANITGGYRLTQKWELSVRASYLSGRPYTPFDTRLSTQQSRAIFDLNRVNAERLPDYFRLDLRADRRFTVKGKPVLFFIGAQNITNRKNTAGFTWNRRLNTQLVNEQLGLFPTIGLDWRF